MPVRFSADTQQLGTGAFRSLHRCGEPGFLAALSHELRKLLGAVAPKPVGGHALEAATGEDLAPVACTPDGSPLHRAGLDRA